MKVLLSGVDRKTAYQIIETFHEVMKSMNYPVSSYREGVLTFVDIEEGFTKVTIYYDGSTRSVRMK